MSEKMEFDGIELSEEDKAIFNDPIKVFAIMHRLKKIKRIAPQINRYQFALQKTLQILRYLHSFLSDYNIKYTIENLDDRINVNISIEVYSEKATPKDEYVYTFSILRRAFPDLSDAMIHHLTKEVLGRRIRFMDATKQNGNGVNDSSQNVNIDEDIQNTDVV
ncbi:MAG: hypothetical protein QXK24_06720 [Ignisphaera sp.]